MKINLLPDKFYKNQAALVLIVIFFILTSILSGGLVTVYFLSQQQVKTLEQSVQSKKMEQAQLTNNISKQKKEQSEEVQHYLSELKGKQVQFANMAENLDRVVVAHKQEIEGYQIAVPLLEGVEAAVSTENQLLTADGQELIEIELAIKGEKLSNIGALTEALSSIEWIDQANFLSSSAEEESTDQFSSVIKIQALKEKLPSIDRGGEK